METVQSPLLSAPQRLTFDIPDFGHSEAAHRVVCWQWGDERTFPVLCLHGLTRNGRDFDILARALAADYRVLCPDMPGRGQSEWLKDAKGYSYPAYLADINFILEQLRIARLHWIGTSMGGILGMMMVNAQPGLIKALVLNDIGCTIAAQGLQRIAAYAAAPAIFSTRAEAEAALRQRCASFGITSETQWQQLFAHGFLERPDGSTTFACDPQVLAGIAKEDLTKDIDLWPLWEAVTKIPVLLIRGAQSDILPQATAHAMQARHPRLVLEEIAHTGHAPALMADSQIGLIHQWLEKT